MHPDAPSWGPSYDTADPHIAPQRGAHPSPASQSPQISPACLSSPPPAPCSVPTACICIPPVTPSPPALPTCWPLQSWLRPWGFLWGSDAEPLRASCRLSPSPPCPEASPSPSPVSCGCISGCTGLVHPLFQPQCPHAVEFLMPVEHVPKYSHCTDPLVSSTVHPRPPCILTVPVQEGDQPKAGLLTTSSCRGVGLGAAWSRTFLALLSC